MGFHNESSLFNFPHKRIVDDVLERNGPPTEESFTLSDVYVSPEHEEMLSEFRNKTVEEEDDSQPINRVQRLIEMARNKLGNVPGFHAIYDNDDLPDPRNLINQFFKLYKEVNNNSTPESEFYYISDYYILEEVESTRDCILECDTLCDAYGRPLIFKGDAFLLTFGDTPMFDSVYFILTRRGYVIKVDDEWDFTFTTVKAILTYSSTKNMDDLNKIVSSFANDD